jgi:hypothetical protein
VQVRIGVTDAPRVIEVEIEDPEQLIAQVEQAFAKDQRLFRFIDADGRTIVLPLDKLGYMEVEAQRARTVGFAKGDSERVS